MALSSNTLTPNFLCTYKDKQKAIRNQRVNRSIIAGFFLMMILCVGISFLQKRTLDEKENQKLQARQRLENIAVRVDKNLVLKLVEAIRSKNQEIKRIGKKYIGLAVVGEVTDLTPPNVRLLNLTALLSDDPVEKKSDKSRVLVLSGVISGDRMNLESTLAAYLIELNNSPLFDKPEIPKKSFELHRGIEVLKFTASLKIV